LQALTAGEISSDFSWLPPVSNLTLALAASSKVLILAAHVRSLWSVERNAPSSQHFFQDINFRSALFGNGGMNRIRVKDTSTVSGELNRLKSCST